MYKSRSWEALEYKRSTLGAQHSEHKCGQEKIYVDDWYRSVQWQMATEKKITKNYAVQRTSNQNWTELVK